MPEMPLSSSWTNQDILAASTNTFRSNKFIEDIFHVPRTKISLKFIDQWEGINFWLLVVRCASAQLYTLFRTQIRVFLPDSDPGGKGKEWFFSIFLTFQMIMSNFQKKLKILKLEKKIISPFAPDPDLHKK